MEMFLLSDTKDPNPNLKAKLTEEILKHGGSIAYISSSPQDEKRIWFHNTEREYKSFDPKINLEYFDLSDNFSDEDLKKTLSFGALHLSGGNTFEFLNWIRKRNFGDLLRTYLKNNGLIIGVSAGAILLTPNINRAGVFNADRNTVGLTDLSGLNFVDFEFSPHLYGHLSNPEDEVSELKIYSKDIPNIIYACNDHDGIFISNNNIEILGNALKIQAGEII